MRDHGISLSLSLSLSFSLINGSMSNRITDWNLTQKGERKKESDGRRINQVELEPKESKVRKKDLTHKKN